MKPVVPSNIEAEQAVLGAVLLDNSAFLKAVGVMEERHFYREPHQRIFAAMRDLYERNVVINLLTLPDQMSKKGTLEEAGGVSYLAALSDSIPTAQGILHHARLVKEDSVRRQIAMVGRTLSERAKEADSADDLLGEIRQAGKTIADLEREALSEEESSSLLVRPSELPADNLEFLVEGLLLKGALSILSGKDKRGKTLLAQEMAKAICRGEPFLNEFPTQKGAVVAAFLDDPWPLTRLRLGHLDILDDPGLWVTNPEEVDLSNPLAFLADLERAAKLRAAALIVIDALYLLLPPGREAQNDASAMRPLIFVLNQMADRTGAAVLLIGHDRKSGGDVAGSHVIRAGAKSILRLTLPKEGQEDDDEEPGTDRRVLRVESKFLSRCNYTLQLAGVAGKEGCVEWEFLGKSQEVRKSDTKKAVREFLESGGEGTIDDIAEAIGGRRREDVRNALSDMGDCVVISDRSTGKGRPAKVYAMAASDGISVPALEEAGTENRDGKSDSREPASILDSGEPAPVNPRPEPPDGKSTSQIPVTTGCKKADGLSVPKSSPRQGDTESPEREKLSL